MRIDPISGNLEEVCCSVAVTGAKLTQGSDERSPDKQRLAPVTVRQDASWQVHHQACNGVHRDCCADCCSAHSKTLHTPCWPLSLQGDVTVLCFLRHVGLHKPQAAGFFLTSRQDGSLYS